MKIITTIFLCLCLQLGLSAEHFLSFVIPCYNCEKWVKDAIESIYQQALTCPFEIICTNDASTDRTMEVLEELAKIHPELYIFQHSKNRGGSAARNTCVSHSRGDIIFCLDSDNALFPNSVQQLIDYMDKLNADVVSFGGLAYFIDDFNVKEYLAYELPCHGYTLQHLLEFAANPAWSGNYLYTRKSFDLAGGYPENTTALDTFAFGFMQARHGCKMAYVPNTYYYHRHGIDSYYLRESRSNRLQLNFLNFILLNKDLFTTETVVFLERQYLLTLDDNAVYNHISFIENKLLKLKEIDAVSLGMNFGGRDLSRSK